MRSTHKAHQLISEFLSGGEVVIDATAGNGHDTLFLADLIGDDCMPDGYVKPATPVEPDGATNGLVGRRAHRLRAWHRLLAHGPSLPLRIRRQDRQAVAPRDR